MAVDTSAAPAAPPATPAPAKPHQASPFGWVLRGAFYLLIVWFVLVWAVGTEDRAGLSTDAVVFAIIGLSLNIIIGYTGQLSLGHHGFVGAGAFAAAYSATKHGVPFEASIVLAALIGAIFALLLGLVALRITGLYLALITLVFGLTLEVSLFEQEDLTNGGAGQPAARPDWLIEPKRFYFFCLAMIAIVLFVDWRLTKTKTGRALFALRENERVAAAFGINVTGFKLLAFTLSGAFAGLGGALFAYRIENVTGADYDFFLALTFVLMVVVGGLNSRVGVVVGSALFSPWGFDQLFEKKAVHDFLLKIFTDQQVQFAPRAIGALLLLTTLIFNPGGIAQQLKPLTRWLGGGPFTFKHEGDAGPGAVEGSSVRA